MRASQGRGGNVWDSLVAQTLVKNPPAMQDFKRQGGVQSLGQEDPLKEEMATQSRILAWRIPWTEEPGGQQSMGLQRLGHDSAHTLLCILHQEKKK